jgi:transposase
MPHIQGVQRDAVLLFPASLDEYITPDNPVRFSDAFVDQLEVQALGFRRALPARTGRPAYHPGDLLKLSIYGYLNPIRSSRLLERETQRNLELIWLLKKLTPDFKTIADFRKDNLHDLDTQDRHDHNPPRLTASELQTRIDQLRARQQQYQSLREQLAARGESQISLTDPESRSISSGQGVELCYNVQVVTDAKHKLIVANDVTNDPTDSNQLAPMAISAKEILGVETLEATADRGYAHGEQVQIV